ncbi:HNH endonuclease [Streptomyces sp. NPDC057757]|uniref:HNH endonuclease n=1 Tax=Streptomyces sp. NPDC057757 TaxID=3346241 RepID=UPI0036989614
MAGIRNGRRYRRLVAAQKAYGLPCWICGHNIPTNVDGRTHPLAFTLDHYEPVSKRPDLLLDPANARSAHRRCNSSRGARTTARPKAARRPALRW